MSVYLYSGEINELTSMLVTRPLPRTSQSFQFLMKVNRKPGFTTTACSRVTSTSKVCPGVSCSEASVGLMLPKGFLFTHQVSNFVISTASEDLRRI